MKKRSFLSFLFIFLLISVCGISLDSLQNAFNKMQEKLNDYKDIALKPQSSGQDIAAVRDEYLKAKLEYEALKSIFKVSPNSPSVSRSKKTSAPPAEKPNEIRITTDEGINKVISKLTSGAKVTEKDLDFQFKPTKNNLLELKTGEDFWKSVITDIKSAKSSIHIQMFGMEADKTGWEFAQMLAEKAKAGVEVVIVADRSGARMMGPKNLVSTTEEEKLFKFYKDNGVKVVFYDRVSRGTNLLNKLDFYHFDHRKTFVIDGKTAYVGGYTLQQPSRELKHDMMVKAQGSVVNQIQASLLMTHLYNGGKIAPAKSAQDLRQKYFPDPASGGKMDANMLFNIPRGSHDLTESYLKEIDSAKDYLYIINPYITNDDMVRHIAAAAKRGVKVKMVHPGSAENPLNDANTRYHFEELEKAGVEIYLYQGENGLGKLHAKGIIRDDKFASIGSANMDTMALYHNYEQNLVSTSPEFVKKVREELFEKDFKVSTRYEAPSGWWQKLKIKIKGKATQLLDRFD